MAHRRPSRRWRISLTIRGEKGENQVLVATDPVRYFLPPYMAHHGYIGVYLDTPTVDWDEIRDLILDAYRIVAPKSLAKLLA